MRRVIAGAVSLAMIGCNAILGLNASTLAPDASVAADTGTPSGDSGVGIGDGSGDTNTVDSSETSTGDGGGADSGSRDAANMDDGEGGCATACSGTCSGGRCVVILADLADASEAIGQMALGASNVYFTTW